MKEQEDSSTANVFLIEVDRRFWFDVWKKLTTEMNVNVSCLSTSDKLVDEAGKAFPEAILLISEMSKRGIYPEKYAEQKFPALDAELLDTYSYNMLHALQMMDCIDLYNYVGFAERFNLFKRHLKYWLGMIESLKPDFVFFPTAPHEVYDYVLYQICKKNRIKTLFFEHTSVGTVFIREDLMDDRPIERCYNELLKEESLNSKLQERLSRELDKLKGDYSEGKLYFMDKYFLNSD